MQQNVDVIEIKTIDSLQSPQELRARASFYQLLAGAFAEEPRREYLDNLRAPETLATLNEMGVQFDADFTDISLTELEDALSCEYSCLFVVSGGLPPLESVRLTGRLKQAPYNEAVATYKRCGFDLLPLKFPIFEDHLGAELLFVAALLESQATALESGKTDVAKRLDREAKRFWAMHLGRWVRGFSDLLERAAMHSFYREMARMLSAFAEEEMAILKVRVDDVDGGREIVPKSEIPIELNPDESVCNACEHGQKTAKEGR